MKRAKVKTVLVTGAAGVVATHLRRELAGRYALRLSDVRAVRDLGPRETFARGNLTKLAHALRITKGVDAIVHLGGYAVEGPWEAILEANVIGCYNLFEAARRNGVRRVVFASSNHAVGFHRRDQVIDHRAQARPDSRYGVSKVFGEVLARLYVDKYGLEVLCVRIGNVSRGIRGPGTTTPTRRASGIFRATTPNGSRRRSSRAARPRIPWRPSPRAGISR